MDERERHCDADTYGDGDAIVDGNANADTYAYCDSDRYANGNAHAYHSTYTDTHRNGDTDTDCDPYIYAVCDADVAGEDAHANRDAYGYGDSNAESYGHATNRRSVCTVRRKYVLLLGRYLDDPRCRGGTTTVGNRAHGEHRNGGDCRRRGVPLTQRFDMSALDGPRHRPGMGHRVIQRRVTGRARRPNL